LSALILKSDAQDWQSSSPAFFSQLGYIAYRTIETWAMVLHFRPNSPTYDEATKEFARLTRLIMTHAMEVVPAYDQIEVSTESICNIYFRVASQNRAEYAALAMHYAQFLKKHCDLAAVSNQRFWIEYFPLLDACTTALGQMYDASGALQTPSYQKHQILVEELFSDLYHACA
jgi:hypothetical protein